MSKSKEESDEDEHDKLFKVVLEDPSDGVEIKRKKTLVTINQGESKGKILDQQNKLLEYYLGEK